MPEDSANAGDAAAAEVAKPEDAASAAQPVGAAKPEDAGNAAKVVDAAEPEDTGNAVKPENAADTKDTVEPGRTVEIFGLVQGANFNGSMGVVEEFVESKQRWKVKFDSGIVKNFKTDNLRVIKIKKKKKKDRPPTETQLEDTASKKAPSASEAAAKALLPGQRNAKVAGSLTETLRLLGLAGNLSEPPPAPVEEPEDTAPDVAMAEAEEVLAREEAPAEEKGPRAEVAARVNLAGRWFETRNMLIDHIRAMCARLEESANKVLAGEDLFLFFHLCMRNPKILGRFRGAAKGFRYGQHGGFPSKCFIAIFKDGTEEPISWMKSVKELYTGSGSLKRPAEEEVALVPAKRAKKQVEKELTRKEKGLKLLQEVAAEKGHPLASRWEYKLKDEARRCFVGYLPCPLGADLLTDLWEKVKSGTKWDRPVDPRSGEPMPRKTSWLTRGFDCSYRYGGVEVEPQEFPAWMTDVLRAFMPLCGLTEPEEWPNCCNLNMYDNGNMSVGWHADDEALFKARYDDARIISVSLGHSRSFEMRLSAADEDEGARDKLVMRLENGDICSMEGLCQKYYQHRVPKEKASGPRINLTWRWIRKLPKHRSKADVAPAPAAHSTLPLAADSPATPGVADVAASPVGVP